MQGSYPASPSYSGPQQQQPLFIIIPSAGGKPQYKQHHHYEPRALPDSYHAAPPAYHRRSLSSAYQRRSSSLLRRKQQKHQRHPQQQSRPPAATSVSSYLSGVVGQTWRPSPRVTSGTDLASRLSVDSNAADTKLAERPANKLAIGQSLSTSRPVGGLHSTVRSTRWPASIGHLIERQPQASSPAPAVLENPLQLQSNASKRPPLALPLSLQLQAPLGGESIARQVAGDEEDNNWPTTMEQMEPFQQQHHFGRDLLLDSLPKQSPESQQIV